MISFSSAAIEVVRAMQRVEIADVVQRPRRRFDARVELVEMPAKSADDAGSLRDQVFSMINEEPNLSTLAVEPCGREVGLAQGRSRERERVDRVRLPVGGGAVTGVRHQLRRHPDDTFTRCDQITLEPPREVPAVLDRPHQLLAPYQLLAALPRPREQSEVIRRRRAERSHCELSTLLVSDYCCMAALVRINPDRHHSSSSFRQSREYGGPVDRQIPVGAKPRSSQATTAGPSTSHEPHD